MEHFGSSALTEVGLSQEILTVRAQVVAQPLPSWAE